MRVPSPSGRGAGPPGAPDPRRNGPRCVFLNTYYPGFLSSHYGRHPGLAARPYAEQKRSLQDFCFGDSDFYSRGLREAGWWAEDLIVNCDPLQQAWARERGLPASGLAVCLEQLREARPDVVYLQDLGLADPEFLRALRPLTTLIAGQIASPVPPGADLASLDLIVSSFPHFAEDFRKRGLTAYYQPLAFDERVWERVSGTPRTHAVTFVGGISPSHRGGTEFLEKLAGMLPMDFWGYGSDSLHPQSAVKARHHGEAWGADMFALLAASRITVNRHIDTAKNNANNMRLFEATGCGALLLTDYKDNLHELFAIGKEVVAYRSPEECAALVEYYLAHPAEAEAIARAGQARTLRDHGYLGRMRKTAEILERHLRYRREAGSGDRPDYSRISYGQTPIEAREVTASHADAWKDGSIPGRQRALTQAELARLYAGQEVVPYAALADSLAPIAGPGEQVLEIGCSTGYYYEVLEYLLKRPLAYTGVDYSAPMIGMAKDYYPRGDFKVADGADLPFATGSFPVVVSSCVLLHVANYREHIRETARVAGRWVVAHRTPVCRNRPTHYLKKFGYGVEMVELVFNEAELLSLFAAEGLELVRSFEVGGPAGGDELTMNYIFRKPPAPEPGAPETRHYCTLFDRNYLGKGMALARSLETHEKQPYVLHAVCLDEISRVILDGLALPGVRAVALHDIEAGDASLLAARADRSLVEYYWTLTPSIIRWFLRRLPQGGLVTYLDSDLFFFSPPDPVFAELGGDSVLIHGHRFSPAMEYLAKDNGIYNVGLLCFRRDGRGLAALEWWRDRCLEWCKAKAEDGKMGDQKYLDDWPERFAGVRVLAHVGAGMAPWNHDQYFLEAGQAPGGAYVDGLPVVFYHFHALAMPTPDVVVPVKHPHYPLTLELVRLLYLPYASALRRAHADIAVRLPSFRFGFQDMEALQVGVTFLLRPGLEVSGTAGMTVVEMDGWRCHCSQQMKAQAPVRHAAPPPRSAPVSRNGHANGRSADPASGPADWGVGRMPAAPEQDPALPADDLEIQRAREAFASGKAGEAEELISLHLRRRPGDARGLNELGVIQYATGRRDLALRTFLASVKADSRYDEAVLNLADALGGAGLLAEALQLCYCFLDAAPDHPRVLAAAARLEERIADGLVSRGSLVDLNFKPKPYKVSALVSTYKSEAFMRECLDDLEAQTIAGDLEIIVVDADSPQGESAIVREYQERYGNIRYIRTHERIGIYPAWNLAVRLSSGRYLTPMSTNDRLAPDAYEVMAKALDADPGVALVYGDTDLTNLPHERFGAHTPTSDYGGRFRWPDYSFEDLAMNCRVGPHPMWRREVHGTVGYFDGRYKAIGDQDFWIRLGIGHRLLHIPCVTGLAWITKDSLSGASTSMDEILAIHHKHTTAHLERLKARVSPRAAPGKASLPAALPVADASAGPERRKATAIVSTYASERFLRGCLQNLVEQTLFRAGGLEVVVVDSGSPESERSIAEEYVAGHAGITYMRTQRETLYAAWNRAARAAAGLYLVNANTDDRHRADAFEAMARELDRRDVGLVYADALLTESENETFASNTARRAWTLPEFSVRQALVDCPFGCVVMWRRDLHARFGHFDPGFRIAGDYEFFLRASLGSGAWHLPEALALYYESPKNLSYGDQGAVDREVNSFLPRFRRETDLASAYPFLRSDASPAARAAAHTDLAALFLHPLGRMGPAESEHHLRLAMEAVGPAPEILGNLFLSLLDQRKFGEAKSVIADLARLDPSAAETIAAGMRETPPKRMLFRLRHAGLLDLPAVAFAEHSRVPLSGYGQTVPPRKAAIHG